MLGSKRLNMGLHMLKETFKLNSFRIGRGDTVQWASFANDIRGLSKFLSIRDYTHFTLPTFLRVTRFMG